MDHPSTRSGRKVTKLHDLAAARVVPDVIVVGIGTWMLLMRYYDDELVPFTELDMLTRPVVEPLTRLASRTTLLLWSQSRYRWFNYEEVSPEMTDLDEVWERKIYYNQFSDAIPFTDAWLWRLLRWRSF
ncbi:uncharacterized protein LOC121874654 [Homarus americanus]|uniref:uncharacterized protein LOC121874654 n=1 Tax=Homarus americanus TaxID=6706 RepID=UPI001C464EFB|nr:uncharacterized protein LOC121874654 [Homarus americanus]